MMIYLKRFYLSLIALTLVFMIFGTVTYAWISMASVNTVDGMSLTATSGNELLISIDGINYAQDLPAAALDEILRNVRLVDVTSTDGINFQRGGLSENEAVIPNQHYLTFELWIQTVQPEHDIYLVDNVNSQVSYDTTMSGTYVVSQGIHWKPEVAFINGPLVTDIVQKNEEHVYYASDAVRISIRELKDRENPYDTRSDDELNMLIYDPSEDETRGYGISYGAYSYFLASSNMSLILPEPLTNISYRLSSFDPYDPYLALDDTSRVARLQPTDQVNVQGKTYYRGKIVVTIWIEGWDADAFNSILSDRIKVQLRFKAARSSTS